MSGPERRTPDDQLLDRYLDGHSEVSRAYRRTSAPQPSADLDRRILDMARSELEKAPLARTAPRRGNRWRTPLAAAAVIVLSFGVLINLQREDTLPTTVPELPAQRRPEAAKEAERAPAPAVAPEAIRAEPQVSQQKAERDAEQKRRSASEAVSDRAAARAPAALVQPQAAAADSGTLAAPSGEAWSCQVPDAQWSRIRRLFAARQPEQAREAYRELESACPDIEAPEDLRERLRGTADDAGR